LLKPAKVSGYVALAVAWTLADLAGRTSLKVDEVKPHSASGSQTACVQ
jgi:hypothetical protein